jgi:uncharacterized protein YejL (UPF0352 family)
MTDISVIAEHATAVVDLLQQRKVMVSEGLGVIGSVATMLIMNYPKAEREATITDFCRILRESVTQEEIHQ